MFLKNQLSQIYDVFSRRRTPTPIGYQEPPISDRLRGKVVVLYRDVVSGRLRDRHFVSSEDNTGEFWDQIYNSLEHLYGPAKVASSQARNAAEAGYLFACQCSTDEFLDFIELSFKIPIAWRIFGEPNDFVDALNQILVFEQFPYRLTRAVKVEEFDQDARHGYGAKTIRTVAHPRIVRAEDEVTHREAVEPALSVLTAPYFEAANLEFRDALEEYRRGHYGDCLTKCGSAFESVLKVLCERNKWTSAKDTPAGLLQTVIANSKMDSFFEQPLILIATMRNKLSSSHGGGSTVRTVDRHVAQFALTSTAAAIVLLAHEVGG